MAAIRWWGAALGLLLGLGGCASANPPAKVEPVGANPFRTVQEISGGQLDGQQVTLIAPVLRRDNRQVLAPALGLTGPGAPVALPANSGAEVALSGPALTGLAELAGAGYGVVRVSGMVQAQGQRGLEVTSSKVVAPVPIGLRELLANTSVYDGQVVALDGTLLIKPGSALLVEGVGAGGVPATDAQQIKLAQPFDDPALVAALAGGSAGNVRYGKVRAVGIWRASTLSVFWAQLAP